MGHTQFGQIDNFFVDSDDIDVYHAVGIRSVGISVGSRRYATLYGLELPQNFHWRKVGDKHHPDVEKSIRGVEAQWGRLHYMGEFEISELFFNSSDSLRKIAATVAQIRTYINEYIHSWSKITENYGKRTP